MIIMKRENKISYVSPDLEIVAVACEQAVMSSSSPGVCLGASGVDNEEFVNGGTFSDWK